jgi:tRNA dimethylallyltransferase
MQKIICIVGPTATGKTDIALQLAKQLQTDLIACDSRQVYQGLDIGTGKLPSDNAVVKKNKEYWLVDGVKIWMYDCVSLRENFTVKDYVDKTRKIVQTLHAQGKVPIIVGGTGFYLKALLEGLPSLEVTENKKLRKELEKLSVDQLQNKLQQLSISKLEELNLSDRQNPRRLIRWIEIYSQFPNGLPPAVKDEEYSVLKIGLSAPRDILYAKINKRVLKWLDQGIVSEVEELQKEGVSWQKFKDLGLEYGIIAEYLQNKITVEYLIVQMQLVVRQYAKRQLTWFRKEKDIIWFDVTKPNYISQVEKCILDWYNN